MSRAQKASAITRERFDYVMVQLIGTKVCVAMRNESTYEGIFHSINVEGDFSFILKNARELAHPTNADRRSGPLIPTLMIPFNDFLALKEAPPPPHRKSDEDASASPADRIATARSSEDPKEGKAEEHGVRKMHTAASEGEDDDVHATVPRGDDIAKTNKMPHLDTRTNAVLLSQSNDPRERRTRGLRLNALNLELPDDRRLQGPPNPLEPLRSKVAVPAIGSPTPGPIPPPNNATESTVESKVPPLSLDPQPQANSVARNLAAFDEALAKKGESKRLNALNLEPALVADSKHRHISSPKVPRDRHDKRDDVPQQAQHAPQQLQLQHAHQQEQRQQQQQQQQPQHQQQQQHNPHQQQQQFQQYQQSQSGPGNKSFPFNPNATSFSPVTHGPGASGGDNPQQSAGSKGDDKGKGKGKKDDDKKAREFTPLVVHNSKLQISDVLKAYTELAMQEIRDHVEDEPAPKWDTNSSSFRDTLGAPLILTNVAQPNWVQPHQNSHNPGPGSHPPGPPVQGHIPSFVPGLNMPPHMMQQGGPGVPMQGIPMLQMQGMNHNMQGMQGMQPNMQNMPMQGGIPMQHGMGGQLMPMGMTMPIMQQPIMNMGPGDQMMPNQGYNRSWEQ